MFSNYYQIGESIELFNSHDNSLLSKWGFIGKCSKVYDPRLHTYEMVLSVGNLSKMEIPKTTKIKTLSLFQSFIVFQLYLFTSKQLTIEIAISDSTNAKRRLIFSTNNSDLAINQLHCRIPIFKMPIGRWINLSIDILSFVSKCYKNLTFRSVDYISLSMSGKVRYIFAMRTPLIELNNKFEIDEEGNIIENSELNGDNINNFGEDQNYNNDNGDNYNEEKDNNENYNFYPGAQDVPKKYKFPQIERAININIDCNKVFSQIYIENENKQIMLTKKELFNTNRNPVCIQDTANANKMDKSLKFKNLNSYGSQRWEKNKVKSDNKGNFNIRKKNNNINFNSTNDIKKEHQKFKINNNTYNLNLNAHNQKQGNTFNKLGNLIISQSNNVLNGLNKKHTYNFDRNNIKLNMYNNKYNDNIYNNINQINNEKKYISASKENNEIERYDLFNKEEYNNLYKKGKGVTNQVKQHINLNHMNINNVNKFNIKELDDKINSELSTIHNINNENFNFMKTLDIEPDTLENNKNEDKIAKQYK